ncbi:MAG: hypothetical protein CVU64_02410 [Deltaproteobacteria bacterium HGW-Deltaproteobacteria-21]|nr:MAG: hypothetical protein CVU64_02410 [Deltaproteobacteria bacterium HGW-Deltaproteobacteria-21]
MKNRKSVRGFGVILTVLCLLCTTQGDAKHWEFAGWNGGGCYPNVEFDSSVKGRIYLVSDVAGIWRSNDSGENWSFMTRGLKNLNVSFIAIAPSDSNVLYAGTARGLFVRREADKSWEPCDTAGGEIRFVRPVNHRSAAISRSSPNVISVGTASGSLFHSTNGGRTWQILGGVKKPFGDDKPLTSLAYSNTGKVLYVASERGLASFSFATKEWANLKGGPSRVTDLALGKGSPERLYVAGQDALFISEDGGKTWKQSTPAPAGTTYRVSVFDSQREVLIAAAWKKDWTGGVVLSRDDGRTWTPANRNFSADRSNPTRTWANTGVPVTAIKIDPFDERVLFRTDWWGVWRSDDGGASWKEKIEGAPNVVGSDIVMGVTGNIYVAAMDDGLVKSSDGGRSYRPLFPVKGYKKDLNGHIWRVLVQGEKDETIIATSSPWGEEVNQVILSTDGGTSFTTVRNGLPSRRPKVNTLWGQGYPRALAADFQNPNNLYLGIDGDDGGGLYLSRDGGRNWTPSKGQPGSRKIYNGLEVDPFHPTHLYWGACGEDGGVYQSKDGGTSWQRIFSAMRWVFDLKIAGNGNVYAAGDNGGPCLYSSSDHGASWKLVKKFASPGIAEAITIDPGDPRRMALSIVQWGGGSGGRIFMTEDGGKSWEDITGDLPEGAGAAAMAFSHKNGFLYISRYAGSVYRADVINSKIPLHSNH